MSNWILCTLIIAIIHNNFTIGLRVKYSTCRELGSKTYTDPYYRINYDACSDPLFCSGISDDEYQTIDPINGFIIEAGSWATKTITVEPSVYDSNTDCLYYDDNSVLNKNELYRFSYDDTDSDSCGCTTIGNTIFCYDCYIWLCSDDQSTLCTSAEGTAAPTPQPTTAELSTTNDFCERDYSLSLTDDAQICDMVDLDNIDSDSKLFDSEGLHSSGPKAAMLWKDNELYLFVVYMEVSKKVIYTDLFDNYGKHIVSNHVIANITGDDIHENNDLADVEIVIKKAIELDEYEDITQFMVMYRYDYDDIVKYTLCEFDGASISNVYEKKEFAPTIADDADLYLYYYSSSYLFQTDAFIIFGRGESSSRAGVIIFDSNGNVLNENGINFEIDYVGSDGFGSSVYGISCGFNATHDICLLNYVEDTSSSLWQYSLASMIAVQRTLTNGNTASVSISIVKDVFDVDYNGNYKVDDAYSPVIITPGYDKFFMQIGGMDYDCCPWYMSAAVYDLNGNVVVNEFSFGADTIYSADCYATYRSGVIVCELAAGEMYVYDINGDALIDNPGTFLTENKVNEYIMQHYSSKFAELGEITDVSDIQVVPLTSNDFWVVFSAETVNYENGIILAVKMSVYEECCDVYVSQQESEESGESDGKSGSISLNHFYLNIIVFVMMSLLSMI